MEHTTIRTTRLLQ
jgi:hypothetical protein